jgi:hypothetical protein
VHYPEYNEDFVIEKLGELLAAKDNPEDLENKINEHLWKWAFLSVSMTLQIEVSNALKKEDPGNPCCKKPISVYFLIGVL